MTDRIVIVGGGLAAARTAQSYRDAGGEAPRDDDLGGARPPLQQAAALEGLPPRRDRGRRGLRCAHDRVRRARRRRRRRARGDGHRGRHGTALRHARRRHRHRVRPPRPRHRGASALARRPRRAARRGALVPHAGRRRGGACRSRESGVGCRRRRRVHRHGDRRLAPAAWARGDARRAGRRALRGATGTRRLAFARAALPRPWRARAARRLDRRVPRRTTAGSSAP